MTDLAFATDRELADELGRRAKSANGACVVAFTKDAKNDSTSTEDSVYFYGGRHACIGLAHDALSKIQRSLLEKDD